MVKNLLNNPWFVGSLGLFAAVYLGWSVAQPLFFAGTGGSEDMVMMDYELVEDEDSENSDGASSDQTEMSERQRAEIRWLHDVSRDPFAGMTYEVGLDQSTEQAPTVDALFVSAGVRAAVVENRLVHVGDSVNQYIVTEIGVDFVELRYKDKALRLQPEA